MFSSQFSSILKFDLLDSINISTILQGVDVVQTDKFDDIFYVSVRAESSYSDRANGSLSRNSKGNRTSTSYIPIRDSKSELHISLNRELSFICSCNLQQRVEIPCRYIVALSHLLASSPTEAKF